MSETTITISQSIDALHQLDRNASEKRNAYELADLYTDDCMLIPPWNEVVTGREAALEFWKNQFNESEKYDLKSIDMTIRELMVCGDWAYEWGVACGVYHIKGNGSEIFDRSRLFRILRLQPDGSWKIARLFWQNI